MATPTTNESSMATADILDGAHSKLRRAFPFMNASGTDSAVAEITQQLQDRLKMLFSFNKLPAELRVRIYELVLAKDEDEPFEVQSCVSDDCHRRPTQHTRQYHLPPILHVSRQIRHEAGPVFYNNTPFIATLYNHQSPQKAVNQWLKVIGKNQAKEINNLLIRFPKGGYSWTDEETSNMMEQPGAEDADFFRAVTAFRSVNTLTKRAVCEALQLGKHGLADDKIKVAYEELFGGCEYFE